MAVILSDEGDCGRGPFVDSGLIVGSVLNARCCDVFEEMIGVAVRDDC